MEAPFLVLDEELDRFAEALGGKVVRNYHNWPGRWVEWSEGIERRVDVTRLDGDPDLFTISVIAHEDCERTRHWKHETVVEPVPLETLRSKLAESLESAREVVEGWSAEDLSLSSELGAPTRNGFGSNQVAGWSLAILQWVVAPLALGYLVFRLVSCSG